MFDNRSRAQRAIDEMVQLNDILKGNAKTAHLSESTTSEIEVTIVCLASEIIDYYDTQRKLRLEKGDAK